MKHVTFITRSRPEPAGAASQLQHKVRNELDADECEARTTLPTVRASVVDRDSRYDCQLVIANADSAPLRTPVRRLRPGVRGCLQQVVHVRAELRRIGVPMAVHFP